MLRAAEAIAAERSEMALSKGKLAATKELLMEGKEGAFAGKKKFNEPF
jgi:hypothetical protein